MGKQVFLLIFIIVFIVSIIVFLCRSLKFLKHNHNPFYKLSDELADELLTYGVVHYTQKKYASLIKESGQIIPGNEKKWKRAQYDEENGLVWLYSGKDFTPDKSKNEKVKRYLKGKKIETAIKIPVTEDFLTHLTYRKGYYINTFPLKVDNDNAVVYNGHIHITENTQFIDLY